MWKEEFKKMLIGFGHDFLFFCNTLIVILFVMGKQSPEQVGRIELFFQEKDWTIIVLLLSGVIIFAIILQKLFKLIFKLFKLLFP